MVVMWSWKGHWEILCLIIQITTCLTSDQSLEDFIVSLSLKNAGYQDFRLSTIHDACITTNSSSLDVLHKRGSVNEDIELEVPAFGENLYIRARSVRSVLHPRAEVLVTRGDHEHVWTGIHPDCFLSGEVTSHNGTVTLAYCDGVTGLISTPRHLYRVDSVPGHLQSTDKQTGVTSNILISRKNNTRELSSQDRGDDTVARGQLGQYSTLHKKAVPSHDITIETAVFTDAPFTKLMGTNDTAKRLELMILKYNMVQMEWSRSQMLGYNVTIQIKYINFYETDPSWYKVSGDNYAGLLGTFCTGTQHLPHDHVFMHTGHHGKGLLGTSYQSRVCHPLYRCGYESSHDVITYIATAHETGHVLGMYHDADRGCKPPNVGVMGGYGAGWSTCSRNDMDAFLSSGHTPCLWREDVPLTNVTTPLQSISLKTHLLGQMNTPDEVCEILHETGFRFRKYPHLDVCQLFTCVDMNKGPLYGRMFKHNNNIPGQYCDDGKICFKNGCNTWDHAKEYNLTVQAGGWSQWSAWVPCTRTCGTGLTYRTRSCTNPPPKNHATCVGNSYQASTCSTRPCDGDSENKPTLIKQRASETCSRLIAAGHINGSLHQPTGVRYNNEAETFLTPVLGQCEVQCDPVSGYKVPSFTRFGLMPDGTPCDTTAENTWDKDNWPRRSGMHGRCLQGFCTKFDCEGKTGNKVFDACGVCGGDNSTCHYYGGVYTDVLAKGDRETIAVLPTGAYNIQFWVEYTHTHQTFVEIWSKDGLPVLASYVVSSWIFNDLANPVEFDGTYWYFLFYRQYLYTKGPITSPAIIKAFQHLSNHTTGIHYAYSVPLSVSSCSNVCQNGGAWNQTLCSCDCPSHFYGPTCSSRCNKYCLNGAPLDERTCHCTCNERQTGGTCHCKPLYSGKECRSCVTMLDCTTHGSFNMDTCQCECQPGYTGNTCETDENHAGHLVG
ncbi:A disintegrin and metalloproteinase with thrombospondin motifs 5-like isoform X1 [Mizuhopecten yessoensis]|uniref:A disintegrin and metalloproteinase with thrombospondin motifs 5-like isoform X1 n=1 Tax=Mizuhopecten yessoensis TaxID=6573 RepID=UPI000B457C18|nr:A disintegrin and metalloproteinase with thrombospondin motifs 5-like isoform X1 [Mizuhopecten yessoensis]